MESAENQGQSPQTNQQAAESRDSQTLSKTETIKLLNDSIDRLEQTIKEISENSADDLPSSDSLNTLVSTTQQLAEEATSPAPVISETPSEEAELESTPQGDAPLNPQTRETQSVEQQDKPKEQKTIANVAKDKKKKNFGLIAIGVAAIAIMITGIFWLWLPQQQTSLSSIPKTPATEIIPNNEVNRDLEEIATPTITPEVNIPETNNLETSLDGAAVENNLSADTEIVDSELETPAETSIPQDLVSPGRARNLKMVTIEPDLIFTPEQTLIAALQTKVAKLTQDYATDLVSSIKVDLPQSSLLVEVKDNWYEMEESRQNKLANEMLKRSRKLNFSKLELKDSTGTLVARNPVVGDQVIILQSSQND